MQPQNTDSFAAGENQLDFYNMSHSVDGWIDSAEYESEIIDKNQKRAKYVPVPQTQPNNLA